MRSASEAVEWVEQYHWKATEEFGTVNFCSNCGSVWPCVPSILADAAKRLREALECLVHRCEAEGYSVGSELLQDAKELLEEIQ